MLGARRDRLQEADSGPSYTENMPVTTPAERLRLALDMFELGEQIMRARLRREHPEWTDAQVQDGIRTWLRTRPGAEFGDCPGRPVAMRDAPVEG